MKKEIWLYLLWILVISNLFYQEYWGLNALITAVVTTVVFGYRYFFKAPSEAPPLTTNQKIAWFAGATIWLTTAVSVFFGYGWLPAFLYLLSLAYFVSLQDRSPVSFPLSIMQTSQSFAVGMIRVFTDRVKDNATVSTERSKKILRQGLQFSIGLFVCILFLKLYQFADSDFYELTRFLNLEWISWGFIAYYIILAWILYGIYFYKPEKQLNQVDASLKNDIQADYQDRIQSYFGTPNESRLALILLGVLSAMLLLFLFLDARFILNEYGVQRPVTAYSESVHQGINSLIFSLVLVIILVSYFFRGSLNFNKHKSVKKLAIFWLFLNCILVFTTGLKNYDYILNFGYTYKRLGVLLYLMLCGFGLLLSIYKIYKTKSFWFLIRSTSFSFVASFAVVALFNWNAIIASYNLTHVRQERLDLNYIYELGADSYPYLMNYHLKNKISDTALFYTLVDQIQETRQQLEDQSANTTWRSLNLRDQQLCSRLKKFQFTSVTQVDDRHISSR